MEFNRKQFVTYALLFGDYSVPLAAGLAVLNFAGLVPIQKTTLLTVVVGPYLVWTLYGYLILNGSAAALTTTWFKLRQYRTGVRCFKCGLAAKVTESYECPNCGPMQHGK